MSKRLLTVIISSLVILFALAQVSAQGTIAFISRPDYVDAATGENPDQPQIDALEGAGYTVYTLYPTELELADQATIDSLENADLVICGRSTNSGLYQPPHRVAWNMLTTPLMQIHPYGVRSSRLNWFHSTNMVHFEDAGVVLNATAVEANDAVFGGVALTDGQLPWCVGPCDVLVYTDPGNGRLIASSADDGSVLFVRFQPYVEFYPGANDYAAGHRTYMGNGNDSTTDPNTGETVYNYNNFTAEAQQVWLAEVARMVALPPVEEPEKTIAFISRPDYVDAATGENPDQPQIDDLVAAGYNVFTMYPDDITNAPQTTIDSLNSADLVICGRSTNSGIYQNTHRFVWNALTTPLMQIHPYGIRSSRLNWFKSTNMVHFEEAGTVLNATAVESDDAVFDGVELTDGQLPWCVGPCDVLVYQEAGNGRIVASAVEDSSVLFVRFDPWEEFYPASSDKPAGYRTYMGNGNDSTTDPNTGDTIYNYNNFTDEARLVWLAEVKRMVWLSKDVPEPLKSGTIAFISRPDYVDAATGENPDKPQIDELVAAGYDVVTLYPMELELAEQATIDSLENADLVICGRSTSSGIYQPPHTDAWNALTVPLIQLHPYGVRSSRLNWFNSTNCVHHDEAGAVLNATVEESNDYVFSGVTPVDHQIPWCVGPFDVLEYQDPGNGELMASSAVDTSVLYVRFDAWTECYEGGAVPSGNRVYMGNGNDNTTDPATGDQVFSYDNFTTEAKSVYMLEVERLIAIGPVEEPPDMDVDEGVTAPVAFNLLQNYPNPFNPVTQIEFTLEKPAHTTLSIYNVMGQMVTKLVDMKMASGKHHVAFEAAQYPSGVYFYVLKSGDHVQARKMMLLK